MNEKKLEKEIEVYKELAAKDKKIDIAALMINSLQKDRTNLVPDKARRWAYFVSLLVPPVGIFLAINFYFSDKDDAKIVGHTCVALTVVSIITTVLLAKAIFSTSGVDLNQIQQIKPGDIQQLIE